MNEQYQSSAFPDISIRPAKKLDLRKISYVWHTAYLQKDIERPEPPTAIELDQMYRSTGQDIFEKSWERRQNRFLIASVPANKVSFKIPDKNDQAMAGICEFSQESIRYDKDKLMDALYIERLYTVKSKKSPVGKALMLECLDMAKELDVEAIVLDAPFEDSKEWYIDKVGFQPFLTTIFRPDSLHPHNPKSRALVLYKDNFDQAQDLLLARPTASNSLKVG